MKKTIAISMLCLALVTGMGFGTAAFADSPDSTIYSLASSPVGAADESLDSGTAASDTDVDATDTSRLSTKNGHRFGQRGMRFGMPGADIVSVAASVLGLTTDELKEQIADGQIGDLLIEADKLEEFKAAYLESVKSSFDEAVAAEKMTQEDADKHYANIESKIEAYDGTTNFGPMFKAGSPRPAPAMADAAENQTPGDGSIAAPARRNIHRVGMKPGVAGVNAVSVAASVLGLTTDELKEQVADGKIGDLLLAADKLDEFKAAYLESAKANLDEAVAAGQLTQEEADARYAKSETAMEAYDGTTHLCGGADHGQMPNGRGPRAPKGDSASTSE